MITGKHLVAGAWRETSEKRRSEPATGAGKDFSIGTIEIAEAACGSAQEAFPSFSNTCRADRAKFLDCIAVELEAREAKISEVGASETGLPQARLVSELARTAGQLRLFASHIRDTGYLDVRHDIAQPDRQPVPRPDLRMIQRPVGPVVVFGASNFPLAFSTAGGDTASALAAGCPVIVKGHSAHPGTAELAAQAIDSARQSMGLHPGTFSFVQGGNRAVGHALVQNPAIKAVGFTGSLAGGRALFNLCAARPEPIPFFGELGSVNPVFFLPGMLKNGHTENAIEWATSLIMGVGQFCTNPGLVLLCGGEGANRFMETAAQTLARHPQQYMLTTGIADAYHRGVDEFRDVSGVEVLVSAESDPRMARPALLKTTFATWRENPRLSEEVFGPLGLVVLCDSVAQMSDAARALPGQLTCTIHLAETDTDQASELASILEHKAGRFVFNGFPTGVEVADSMVHSGPYPASTNFGATSVGTLAIRRFLRPVCYQNAPLALLPEELQEV